MSGRRQDALWKHFNRKRAHSEKGKTEYVRAECKKCKKDMAGLVKRMRAHYEKCYGAVYEGTEVVSDSDSDLEGTAIDDDNLDNVMSTPGIFNSNISG
jgi:translation initiation factor 2 alpha subunit (eIF-2alpha)